MATVILVIHLMIALAMIGVVLLQRSEGGALGIGGGGGNFMSGRGAANLLTRTTSILAGMFFLTSLALTILSTGQTGGSDNTILDRISREQQPSAPAQQSGSEGGGVQNLIKTEQEKNKPTGPQVPASK